MRQMVTQVKLSLCILCIILFFHQIYIIQQRDSEEIEPYIKSPVPKFECRGTQTSALIRFSVILQPPWVILGRREGAKH